MKDIIIKIKHQPIIVKRMVEKHCFDMGFKWGLSQAQEKIDFNILKITNFLQVDQNGKLFSEKSDFPDLKELMHLEYYDFLKFNKASFTKFLFDHNEELTKNR